MNMCRAVLSCLAAAAPVATQSNWVVPTAAAQQDGNSLLLAPGSSGDSRRQILIDASLLGAPIAITGIAFRRDASHDHDYVGGSAIAVVTISHSPRTPTTPSAVFDENHDANTGARIVTFSGTVVLPNSASPQGRSVSWSNAGDVVAIDFTTPFAYVGGTLCIDIVARRIPGAECRFWAVDSILDPERGNTTTIGESCNPYRVPSSTGVLSSLAVHPRDLVPGSTAMFTGDGTEGTPAAFLLGFVPLDADLSLVGLAPAGCVLRVDPVVAIVDRFVSDPPLRAGVARVHIGMPTDTGMLGAAFRTQFLELGNALYTSETVVCQIGSSVPGIGMSMVSARVDGPGLPMQGKVATGEAPVLSLRVQ